MGSEEDRMWCHILLTMPLLGLALFFVLPFSPALALYLVLVLLSLLLYYKIMESMQVPVATGPEALLGQVVTTGDDGSIRWQGEWWKARPLLPHQRVRIVDIRGLEVQVEPVEAVENQSGVNT
uniref:NfeD-like C-terminal domain-containing protein n=2 Tax=Litorilinea aerophila TaxID=1204385 RepID=A0A540VHZ3_9CHLR